MKISTRKKVEKVSMLKCAGIFSVFLLIAASAIYLYSPVIKTYAENSVSADVSLRVMDVLSLTLDKESIYLRTDPNRFVSDTVNATASTNSAYGYTLAIEDADAVPNLVHSNESVDSVIISGFVGPLTSDEMEENTWGFSLNSTDYYGMPSRGKPTALKRVNGRVVEEEDKVTAVDFGVKVGNVTSGRYSDKVLFTIYVNGQDGKPTNPDDPENPPADPTEPGFNPANDPTTMQGFSCSSLENIGDSVTLRDIRDDKTYSVRKMADGKCWMNANLSLGGDAPITLTPDNSDVSSVYQLPLPNVTNQNNFPSDPDSDAFYMNGTYGANYNFYTATAGTGTSSLTDQDAPSSICPKGWRLPTSGPERTDNEIYNVFSMYPRTYMDENDEEVSVTFMDDFVSSGSSNYNKWWTSTVSSDGSVYYGYYYRSILNSMTGKTAGNAIRCVAR